MLLYVNHNIINIVTIIIRFRIAIIIWYCAQENKLFAVTGWRTSTTTTVHNGAAVLYYYTCTIEFIRHTLYVKRIMRAIKPYAASGNTIARVCVFLRLRRSSSARPNKYINEFICLRLPHSTRIYIAFTVLWFRRDRLSRTSPRVRKRRSFIGFVRPEKRYHYNALWFPYRCTSRSKCHSNKI